MDIISFNSGLSPVKCKGQRQITKNRNDSPTLVSIQGHVKCVFFKKKGDCTKLPKEILIRGRNGGEIGRVLALHVLT